MTETRTPGGVLTGVKPAASAHRPKGPSKRRLLRTALENVDEAEHLIREAADILATQARYRRAGKLVRLAARVELAAMYLSDDLNLETK